MTKKQAKELQNHASLHDNRSAPPTLPIENYINILKKEKAYFM